MTELRKWCDGGMLAVDTNIVIRFLTRDDERQAARSRVIIDENEFWLSKTVLLEVDCVLQSRYKLQPAEAIHAIRMIAGHKNAHVEDAEGVLAAGDPEESAFSLTRDRSLPPPRCGSAN